MEDHKIAILEEKALEYAEIRDQRIKLSQAEGELKGKLLDLMKAQKREHYQRGPIKIDIVHEKENIKVKVKAGGSSDDGDDEDSEDPGDDENDNEPSTVVTVESTTPLSTEAGRTQKIVVVPPPSARSGPKDLKAFHAGEVAAGRSAN